MTARIGKGQVGAARAGELGVDLKHVPHVHHEDEGGAPFLGGKKAHVGFGLRFGLDHAGVVARRAAYPVPLFLGGLFRLAFGVFLLLDALLRLHHERPPAVEVDEARRALAVREHFPDLALEHVGAVSGSGGHIGARHADEVTQLGQEDGVVGPLAPARRRPASHEFFRRLRHVGAVWRLRLALNGPRTEG